MIQCKEFTEDLTLNLLHKIVDGITIDECSLLSIVRVQIEVKRKSIVFEQVISQLLYGIDCRLLGEIWIYIVPIQVFAKIIHPEVPMEDAVHVDHGDYHEDEHLLQQERPYILIIHQKINYPLHSERCSRFTRMHPGSDEDHRLLKPLGSAFLRK
jgi:hypothetical protein